MWLEVIVLLFAGLGAGFITGFLSASAVMFAAPILILFFGLDTYTAIGISLAIDIFASLAAAFIFAKHKNLNFKKSALILFFAVIFVIIGSYFSQFIPEGNLAWAMGVGIFIMGIMIHRRASKKGKFNKHYKASKKTKLFYTALSGVLIGLIAGVFGAGGGLMILFALIFFLNYKTHEAIGTSVFIMIFIALFGSTTHYYYSPFPIWYLVIGIVGGVIGAFLAARVANKTHEKTLTRIVGVVLAILGSLLVLKTVLEILFP